MTTDVQDERRRLHAEAVKALQALVDHYANAEGLPVVGIHVCLAEAIQFGDHCESALIMSVNAEIRTS